jgi:hypothetical protein
MNKATLVLLLLTGFFPTSPAQATTDWYVGHVTLADGTELDGALNYNWKAEIVQIQQGQTTKAYSAFQIDRFTFFDTGINQKRTFVSLDFPVKPTLTRRLVLEQCATGPLMVYRRLRHTRELLKLAKPAAYGSDQTFGQDMGSFVYYAVPIPQPTTDPAAQPLQFLSLDKFYRNIWPLMMEKQGAELRSRVTKSQMPLNDTEGQLILITYYNTLQLRQTAADLPHYGLTASVGE